MTKLELAYVIDYIGLCFLLCIALLSVVSFGTYRTKMDREKVSPYECGFLPFSESRYPFEVQFYIIAIIFLLFDIEVLYLIPLISSLLLLNYIVLINVFLFFFLIIIGVIYEISRNIICFSDN